VPSPNNPNPKSNWKKWVFAALLCTITSLFIKHIFNTSYFTSIFLGLMSVSSIELLFNFIFDNYINNTMGMGVGDNSYSPITHFMTGRGNIGSSTNPIEIRSRSPTPGASTAQPQSVLVATQDLVKSKYPEGIAAYIESNPRAKADVGKLRINNPTYHSNLQHEVTSIRSEIIESLEGHFPPLGPIDFRNVEEELHTIRLNMSTIRKTISGHVGTLQRLINIELEKALLSLSDRQDIKGLGEYKDFLCSGTTIVRLSPGDLYGPDTLLWKESAHINEWESKITECIHTLGILANSYPEGSSEAKYIRDKQNHYINELCARLAKHHLYIARLEDLESHTNSYRVRRF